MDTTGAATRETGRRTRPDRRGAVVAALMLAMALAALDSTVVSTAVPQIVGDLGGFSVFSWLFSGYLLAVTVTLPVYGKLSDTVGRKPVLIVGAVLFLLGSLLCALAWNMGALIAFRIVQGLGGGALQGTVQTLAADLYPLKERPRIQSKLSTVWAVSAVAGPALGGVLATYADWRWIFLINLPVGAVALWLIVRHLREPDREPGPRPRVDWAGALTVFACGGVLLTALVQGGVAWPWLSAPSLTLFGTGLALIALVVAVERRAAEPIIPGWVWRRRTIAAVNLALGALGLLMVAPTVFLPTYAQAVLGLAPVAGRVRALRLDPELASTVGWSERGTTTASVLFCRQTGQTAGAAVFGAIANGVLASRLGGSGDLDAVTRALDHGSASEATRRAIASAVHAVYLGASCAAALAFLVLLLLAPRRFPVLDS
ncbi:multidrug resistance protein [Streptomyces nodosus]|nr:multidrug resistance protein [Streptomyces nodosus]